MKAIITAIFCLVVFSCNNQTHPDSAGTPSENNLYPDSSGAVVSKNDSIETKSDSQVTASATIHCDKSLVTTIENFKVWKLNSSGVIVYKAKMAIDADGSPRAYCPDNKGLDWTANAGKPGNWWAVVTDADGNPVIQKASDPSPGCYVSTTTLMDATLPKENPIRYVNSETIPFIVLPKPVLTAGNIKIGDLAYVFNTKNNKSSFAIFADGGPKDKLGEGSIFLAEQLGIKSDPKKGGTGDGVIYIVFPGSGKGNGQLRTIEEINNDAKKELEKIGGTNLVGCLEL